MASRKIPLILISLLLALGGVFLVFDQTQAGPIHNPGFAPFVKVGVYQGVLSIVPGGATDSVMEIGYEGRIIAGTGQIQIRPDSASLTVAQLNNLNLRARFYLGTGGGTALSIPGPLCLNGACINNWGDIAAAAPTLDVVLAAGNTSSRSASLGTALAPIAKLLVHNTTSGAIPGPSNQGSAGDAIAAYANSVNAAVYGQQSGTGWAGYFSGGQGLYANRIEAHKILVDYPTEFLAPGGGAYGIYSQITAGAGCNTGQQCAAIYGQDLTHSVFANRLDLSGFFWAGYFQGPVGIDNSDRPSSSLLVGSNFDGNYALEVRSHNDTKNAATFLGDVRVSQMITTQEVNSDCYKSWVTTTTSAVTNAITVADVNARCDGKNCTIDLSIPAGGASTGISSGRYRRDLTGDKKVFVGLESLGGGDGAASPVKRFINTVNETILANSTDVAGQLCTFRWTGTAYELVHPANAAGYFCDLRICD